MVLGIGAAYGLELVGIGPSLSRFSQSGCLLVMPLSLRKATLQVRVAQPALQGYKEPTGLPTVKLLQRLC